MLGVREFPPYCLCLSTTPARRCRTPGHRKTHEPLVKSRQAHLASVCLVCRDFDSIVRSNRQLARKLMKAVRFANEHGSGVDVVDDGAAAVCKTTRTGYPHIFSHTAWVTYEADTATATPHASLASRNSLGSKEQLYLAHFSIDEEPSIYFSISLSMVRTAVARVDCPLHFMVSYFGDGDLHAYGSRASYRESNRDEARFKKGDIISVQLGMYDAYKAHQSYKFTPKPQEWRRVVEAKNTRSRIYDESVTNRDRFPSYPYVIFFKNFKMVHDPIVFPDVEQWPVYVGAFLTKQGEKVSLMTPSPPAQRFAPVFPYPPDKRSREEDERELREREARERRELERWEESRRWMNRTRSHSDESDRRKESERKRKEHKEKEKEKKKEHKEKEKEKEKEHKEQERKAKEKEAKEIIARQGTAAKEDKPQHHHPHLSLRFWRKRAGLGDTA